jgi:hypothetical protein
VTRSNAISSSCTNPAGLPPEWNEFPHLLKRHGVRFLLVVDLGRNGLLELEAAVRAGAIDQGRGGPAGRARQVLGVAGGSKLGGELDGCNAFAHELGAPVVAQELGQLGELVLLDQEVRSGPSAFAGAWGTADEGGDAGGQAAIAQGLHLGDRAGHRRDERKAVEQFIRHAGC